MAIICREKISGATAERPQFKKLMARLSAGDVAVIPVVDRLSRDTTDLMVITRDIQRAGAGLRSLAEPVLIPRAISQSLCLPCLAWPRSWNAAASPSEPHEVYNVSRAMISRLAA